MEQDVLDIFTDEPMRMLTEDEITELVRKQEEYLLDLYLG